MSHGTALKLAWSAFDRPVSVGELVDYFQMSLPCNGSIGPGPHKATVTSVNSDKSLHLLVKWSGKLKATDERFVSHRGLADAGRFWDFKR